LYSEINQTLVKDIDTNIHINSLEQSKSNDLGPQIFLWLRKWYQTADFRDLEQQKVVEETFSIEVLAVSYLSLEERKARDEDYAYIPIDIWKFVNSMPLPRDRKCVIEKSIIGLESLGEYGRIIEHLDRGKELISLKVKNALDTCHSSLKEITSKGSILLIVKIDFGESFLWVRSIVTRILQIRFPIRTSQKLLYYNFQMIYFCI
jgi:hypothetical protein